MTIPADFVDFLGIPSQGVIRRNVNESDQYFTVCSFLTSTRTPNQSLISYGIQAVPGSAQCKLSFSYI